MTSGIWICAARDIGPAESLNFRRKARPAAWTGPRKLAKIDLLLPTHDRAGAMRRIINAPDNLNMPRILRIVLLCIGLGSASLVAAQSAIDNLIGNQGATGNSLPSGTTLAPGATSSPQSPAGALPAFPGAFFPGSTNPGSSAITNRGRSPAGTGGATQGRTGFGDYQDRMGMQERKPVEVKESLLATG